MARKPVSAETQTAVLLKARRRCCICFGLNRSTNLVAGQIAHLDGDSSNNAEDNLAFLCLTHHDEYDSTTSQRKNLTTGEVKHFREELAKALGSAFTQTVHFGEIKTPPSDPYAGQYVRVGSGNDSAEILLTPVPNTIDGLARYFVSGFALWGTSRERGPNMGDLGEAGVMHKPGIVEVYHRPMGERCGFTKLTFSSDGSLSVTEENILGYYGMNVFFSGEYQRVGD